jgi:hypothetical protein
MWFCGGLLDRPTGLLLPLFERHLAFSAPNYLYKRNDAFLRYVWRLTAVQSQFPRCCISLLLLPPPAPLATPSNWRYIYITMFWESLNIVGLCWRNTLQRLTAADRSIPTHDAVGSRLRTPPRTLIFLSVFHHLLTFRNMIRGCPVSFFFQFRIVLSLFACLFLSLFAIGIVYLFVTLFLFLLLCLPVFVFLSYFIIFLLSLYLVFRGGSLPVSCSRIVHYCPDRIYIIDISWPTFVRCCYVDTVSLQVVWILILISSILSGI